MVLLAIDPGPVESAWLRYDVDGRMPLEWAKVPNGEVLRLLDGAQAGPLAVEMIASYGMPVGADVFETCVWIGRFIERYLAGVPMDARVERIKRGEVKMHLCGSMRAKDPHVRQALIDRYGPGKDAAVGRKASPGPLYGLSGDCWSALAVGVTCAETRLVAPEQLAL